MRRLSPGTCEVGEEADHALVADGRRFDDSALLQGDHAGKHPTPGEVHMKQGAVLLVKLFEGV